jgi:hypothetical protein
MHGNPYQFAVYALGSLLFIVAFRYAKRVGAIPAWKWLGAVILALPAIVFSAYYVRVFNEPIWLYRLRAVPGSELLAPLSGIGTGWLAARLDQRFNISTFTTGGLFLGLLFLPYLKSWIWPLDLSTLSQKWNGEVCLQTTPSTCGLASAATVLRMKGINVEESDLAEDAFSTQSGTENWYLKRSIEKHGATCSYVHLTPPFADLPCPSIAGIKLGPGAGHFVAILRDNGDHYEIGDPMHGRIRVRKKEIATNALVFSGFFMTIIPDPKIP